MAKKTFKWDDSALVADSCTIPFGKGTNEAEKVTFVEFPRQTLVKMIEEGMDRKFIREVEPTDAEKAAGQTEPKMDRIPFVEVAEIQKDFLFTYLAEATKGTDNPKDKEWFEALPLTGTALGHLAEMLMGINHIDEVLATGGNWLMLPAITQMMSSGAEENSETQRPTLQA